MILLQIKLIFNNKNELILNKLIIDMLLARIWTFGVKTAKLKPGNYDFLDLVRAPTGNQISITQQEKQKINNQIDKKMQELQDTGLSRQEIILSKSQKGLPLAIDPFFQYLKKNKLAREIYLKKNQRFSVQKVIDIALRQDIGPDPSYSRTRENGVINYKGRASLMNDLQQREEGSFNPRQYYANADTNINKLYDQLKPHQPLRHIYKPINRYERVKTHQKRLKKYDIHWRNVELLRQFLTPFGNIKNRLANRLSSSDQKKVKIAIKAARHNCAIPFYGRTLNPNRKNITNIEDQVKQIGLQNVNLQTGQVYYSRPRSMDSVETEKQMKSDTDYQYQQMISGKSYKLWVESFDQQLSEEQKQAQKYARLLKINQIDERPVTKKKFDPKKIVLQQILGKQQEQDIKHSKELTDEQIEEYRKSYENKMKSFKKKLQKQPFSFSKIILDEKTKL